MISTHSLSARSLALALVLLFSIAGSVAAQGTSTVVSSDSPAAASQRVPLTFQVEVPAFLTETQTLTLTLVLDLSVDPEADANVPIQVNVVDVVQSPANLTAPVAVFWNELGVVTATQTLSLTARQTAGVSVVETVPVTVPNLIGLPTPTPASPAPQVDTPGATATASANLRSGPGTEYAIVGSVAEGQAVDIIAVNPAGDWYQLSDGSWIAVFLVQGQPSADQIAVATDIPPPPPTATATPIPVAESSAPDVKPLRSVPFPQIGEEVEGLGWRFKVAEVHKRKALYFYDESYVAFGHFLVIIIDDYNTQSGTDYFFRALKPYVTDGPGNGYPHSAKGTAYAAWQFGGLGTYASGLNPGKWGRIVAVYDLPDDVGRVLLSTDIPEWIDLGDFTAMPVEE